MTSLLFFVRSSGRRGRMAAAIIVELLAPAAAAAFRDEVQHVPEWLDRAGVARVLARVDRRVEHLRAPEVADRRTVAVEDVQHRLLASRLVLGEIILIVAIAGRGEE